MYRYEDNFRQSAKYEVMIELSIYNLQLLLVTPSLMLYLPQQQVQALTFQSYVSWFLVTDLNSNWPPWRVCLSLTSTTRLCDDRNSPSPTRFGLLVHISWATGVKQRITKFYLQFNKSTSSLSVWNCPSPYKCIGAFDSFRQAVEVFLESGNIIRL